MLEDSTVEKGDEHTRQITVGSQGSMLWVQNPGVFKDTICVTPAQGQKPKNLMIHSS